MLQPTKKTQTHTHTQTKVQTQTHTHTQFEESLPHFEACLDINPLQTGLWFTFGCACLPCRHFNKAAKAFRRCVNLDSDVSGFGGGVMWFVMGCCGVVWCGVVWCGVVWCGVVWCGVVWCGVVWCSVVCVAKMWWDVVVVLDIMNVCLRFHHYIVFIVSNRTSRLGTTWLQRTSNLTTSHDPLKLLK